MARNPTQDEVNSLVGTIYADIHTERIALNKSESLESYSWDSPNWTLHLAKALGSAANEVMTTEDISEIRDSLVQVAAIVSAWIEAVDDIMEGEEEEEE